MNRRQKALALVEALRLLLRVRRMSRRTGIPFEALLQAHLDEIDRRTFLYEQILAEQQLLAYRLDAERQAPLN